MEGAALVWLLCLQGSLLVHTLSCADKGTSTQTQEYRRECEGDEATKALPAELTGLKPLAPSGAMGESGLVQPAKRRRRNTGSKGRRKYGPGVFSVLGITKDTEPTKIPPPVELSRQKRSRKLYYPGSTSVTGQPMRLMLTERSRRQLPHTKPKRKPRVGSFSLLSHKQPKSLQVTRVRRQLQHEKKKKKKLTNSRSRPGWQTAIGGEEMGVASEVTRTRRQLQDDKKQKKPPPGWLSILGEGLPPLPEVTRRRRQLQNDKKRRRPGSFSLVGKGTPPHLDAATKSQKEMKTKEEEP
ncbi:uncharacterized protein si:dkey-12l12.1 [Conger conger]|uniref:uncharacterized protein si:dkey-12l12.1 n=1 Tax=Conger conger TaxID=82655 RepID=UPI002A5A600E|nr:uncharacterized protein si:dkey-12l12.1 [Conger conger]